MARRPGSDRGRGTGTDPAAFCDPPRPLAIGIHNVLVEALAGEFERTAVARFLRTWVRQSHYRDSLTEGAARHDLDGQPVGVVTAAERAKGAVQ